MCLKTACLLAKNVLLRKKSLVTVTTCQTKAKIGHFQVQRDPDNA